MSTNTKAVEAFVAELVKDEQLRAQAKASGTSAAAIVAFANGKGFHFSEADLAQAHQNLINREGAAPLSDEALGTVSGAGIGEIVSDIFEWLWQAGGTMHHIERRP